MQGEGKKFRSLEVRGKLIALKKAFKIKFKTVQKRSLKCISLILNIIYYLERQALYDNFFLYPVVIESSLIYIGAWSTLSNIFFWWIKITVSLVVRTSDLHHLLTLFAYRRSLDNLFVSGQAVGSSDCLVEDGAKDREARTKILFFVLLFPYCFINIKKKKGYITMYGWHNTMCYTSMQCKCLKYLNVHFRLQLYFSFNFQLWFPLS